MRTISLSAIAGAIASAGLFAAPVVAQEPEPAATEADSSQELAKQLANPVASLISVPLQQNVDFGIGPEDGVRMTLNIQPVVPFALSKDWNLIVRTILPVTFQDEVTGPSQEEFGLGDTTQSFFFSPAHPVNGLVWAVGPVFVYPSATDEVLGGEKWGAGPTALVLKQAGGNSFGLLANHIWSIAGDDTRADVSNTFLQPFFSHTTKSATTFGLNAETSYNWKAEQWTVPLNLTVSQLTKIGKQPVSIGGGVRYYAEKPEGGPEWGVRLIVTFLFPKK